MKRMHYLIPFFLVSCGVAEVAQQEQNTEQTEQPEIVAEEIDNSGGEVVVANTGGNALVVTFPVGALSETTEVTVEEIEDASAALPENWDSGDAVETMGQLFEIGPSGTVFDQPVRLTFRYDPASLGDFSPEELRVATVEDGRWVLLADTILDKDALTISGTTLHLSPFAVVGMRCDPNDAVAAQETCDDGNACTTDSCNALGRCENANNTDACDDGSLCTTDDICTDGVCVGQNAVTCTDSPGSCYADTGTCNPSTGSCVYAFVCECEADADCNDNNTCTFNTCVDGTCVDENVEGLCGQVGYCDLGACIECDDGNPCTYDFISEGGCVNEVSYGACCDAGSAAGLGTCGAGPGGAATCMAPSCQSFGEVSNCISSQNLCTEDADCACIPF